LEQLAGREVNAETYLNIYMINHRTYAPVNGWKCRMGAGRRQKNPGRRDGRRPRVQVVAKGSGRSRGIDRVAWLFLLRLPMGQGDPLVYQRGLKLAVGLGKPARL
jgi:hypothetical protein